MCFLAWFRRWTPPPLDRPKVRSFFLSRHNCRSFFSVGLAPGLAQIDPREAHTRTLGGPWPRPGDHNSTRRPPKFAAGGWKTNREILDVPPFGPHFCWVWGPKFWTSHPSGLPFFFWVWAPPLIFECGRLSLFRTTVPLNPGISERRGEMDAVRPFVFFSDLRRKRRGSASTVAHHRHWNVYDLKKSPRTAEDRRENPSF